MSTLTEGDVWVHSPMRDGAGCGHCGRFAQVDDNNLCRECFYEDELPVVESVTRETQVPDTLYVLANGGYFVTPDGEGRFWFDTLADVEEQYGSDTYTMPAILLTTTPED